jgi:glycosyltransferase involved in cell wall biosynthesis
MTRPLEILVLPDTNPNKIVEQGQRWAFFSHWPEGRYRFDWLKAYRIPLWSRFVEEKLLRFFLAQSVAAFRRGKRYDVVLAHGSRSIVGLAFLHRLFGRRRPKLVVFDIEAFGRAASGLKLRLVRRASESIDAVIYHARAQQDYYDEFLPSLEGKTHFVTLGFGPTPKTLDWEATGRGDFILSFDTIASGRREWDVLLEAHSTIDPRPPLRIVGKQNWTEEDLGGRAPDPSVELLPRIPAPKLRIMMEQCALAVLPLTERGHAHGQLSVLDLMAAGALVVVSNTAGARDYVRHRETGLLYEPGNARDLATQIAWALDHFEARRRIGRNARQAVAESCSLERFSLRTYEIISRLVDETA